jgi:hypothetical protein
MRSNGSDGDGGNDGKTATEARVVNNITDVVEAGDGDENA